MNTSWSNLEEGRTWAAAFAREFTRPCVVLLQGTLGAGKTQLVRWWVDHLNSGELKETASPTFAIHHRYDLKDGAVDHVDLYRMTSDADLESSGFFDLLQEPRGLLFVEWADRLPESFWPGTWKKIFIHLEIPSGNPASRKASIKIIEGT